MAKPQKRPKFIDVTLIWAERKDLERAKNITSDAKASSQANAIKDYEKLVRRARAYISVHEKQDNPFTRKMKELGFTNKQILHVMAPDVFTRLFVKYKNN